LPVAWHADAAVCVVLTSGGYPGAYAQGMPIRGLPPTSSESAMVFHAGTGRRGPDIVTAGGRVLGVVGRGATLADARREAYRVVHSISFAGCHFRTDIGHRALSPAR
jgi:phosphoribosylamine---glycine ligase